MKTYYYEYEDGYYCYYCGKPSAVDIKAEERKHGKVVRVKIEKWGGRPLHIMIYWKYVRICP